MLNDTLQAFNLLKATMLANFHFLLMLMALLWAIQGINYLLGYRLNLLGIRPRRGFGLIGIPFAPFLHGNANHLFFNSIPLFMLAGFVLVYGYPQFYCVSVIIILVSGVLTWLFARPAVHLGASGVVMGYLAYLIMLAYQHPSLLSVIVGLITLYYFAGLLLGLFPQETRVSWEGHVFGFVGGLIAGYYCPMLV